MGDRLPQSIDRSRLKTAEPGYLPAMKELTPGDLDDGPEPADDADELWSEAMSALGLIGSVLLLVLLISLVGRL